MDIQLPVGYFFRVDKPDSDGDICINVQRKGKWFGSTTVMYSYVYKSHRIHSSRPMRDVVKVHMWSLQKRLQQELQAISLAGDYPPKSI